MKRTVAWQGTHDTWLVYEKESGQAVGFAGLEEVQPGIYQDTGIALGPEYVGRGYGRQILRLFPRAMSQAAVLARTVGECREGQKPRSLLRGFWLLEYAISLGGMEFYYSTRSGNAAAKALALSCGFVYLRSEQKTDARSGKPYDLEIYRKSLDGEGSGI